MRLAARQISRSFGSRRVLDGVDLVRDDPGIVGLTGSNGAGKTTLLRIVAQLLEPDAGTLEVCDRVVERADDPIARAQVGLVPHAALAWLDDDVARNLRYAARLAGRDRGAAGELADRAIERWGLRSVAALPVRRLSRGQAQRYGFARADLLAPPILLLDEPTTGLDVAARAHLDAALAQWRVDRVVVVASHEHAWLEAACDQVVALDGAAAGASA